MFRKLVIAIGAIAAIGAATLSPASAKARVCESVVRHVIVNGKPYTYLAEVCH